jgi:hypothetical protein
MATHKEGVLEPFADQKRPTFQDVLAAIQAVEIVAHRLSGALLDDVERRLRETHSNGDALIAAFDIAPNAALDWFASRNRFAEEEILPRLFGQETVTATLPALTIPLPMRSPCVRFKLESSFRIDGILAQLLYQGGAYWQAHGTGRAEKELALAVCDTLFDLRYGEVSVHDIRGVDALV